MPPVKHNRVSNSNSPLPGSKEHFWIGLHESSLSTVLTAEPRYRWTGGCAPLTTEAAWDQQEPPGAGSTRMCVYARNETMKWRTDFCNTSHSFICERQTGEIVSPDRLTCPLYLQLLMLFDEVLQPTLRPFRFISLMFSTLCTISVLAFQTIIVIVLFTLTVLLIIIIIISIVSIITMPFIHKK